MVKSNAGVREEQRYARSEILICAESFLQEETPYAEPAAFAAAVREYLQGELDLEGASVTPEEQRHARFLLADVVEKQFARCTHDAAGDTDWCPHCGCTRSNKPGVWLRPDWRSIILRALLAGLLLLLVACGGSALDVGATLGPQESGASGRGVDPNAPRETGSDVGCSGCRAEQMTGSRPDASPVSVADAAGDVDAAPMLEHDAADADLRELDAIDAAPVLEHEAAPDVDAAPMLEHDASPAAPAVQQCTALPPDQGVTGVYVCNPKASNPYMCGHSCCTLRACP